MCYITYNILIYISLNHIKEIITITKITFENIS